MLEVKNLVSGYGPIEVLHDVSLHVDRGETVVILGPNGAGKSTLIKTIARMMSGSGHVIFQGKDVTRLSTEDLVEMGMVQVPEGRRLFRQMSVYENLTLGAYATYKKTTAKRREELISSVYDLLPILKDRGGQDAGTLSGGEQQMLAIGRALMAEPTIMLMDEPFLGLAPLVIKSISNVINTLREQGRTNLMVEQNARASLKLAQRAYLLELGKIVAEKKASEMHDDDYVRAVYLGK
jgi:branched-chain amino acid transport system ATP-binding protein